MQLLSVFRDKKVRLRDMSLVEKELQFFIDHEVPQVKFVDRTFNCNKKHAMAIWRYIKAHDNGITNFHFEIGADLLDDEELAIRQICVRDWFSWKSVSSPPMTRRFRRFPGPCGWIAWQRLCIP